VTKDLKISFPPITSAEIEVLILGSIPGDRSISENEYYGHPQNRFWRMLPTITGSEIPNSYREKKEILLKHKIGLWDVAHKAVRPGSMDSDIRNAEPNGIPEFICQHPHLKSIGFNGRKAEALFDQFFDRKPEIIYHSLPSTSPANARITFEQLCDRWKVLFDQQIQP